MSIAHGLVTVSESHVTGSTAHGSGGFSLVTSGKLIITQSSVISFSSTVQNADGQEGVLYDGGAITVDGSAEVRVVHSRIESSHSSSEGGCFAFVGGELHLEYATIEGCTTRDVGRATVLHMHYQLNHILLVATFTEFRMLSCEGNMFQLQGPTDEVHRAA